MAWLITLETATQAGPVKYNSTTKPTVVQEDTLVRIVGSGREVVVNLSNFRSVTVTDLDEGEADN